MQGKLILTTGALLVAAAGCARTGKLQAWLKNANGRMPLENPDN